MTNGTFCGWCDTVVAHVTPWASGDGWYLYLCDVCLTDFDEADPCLAECDEV